VKKIKIGEFGKVTNKSVVCFMHFARLANALLKDEKSARDDHVLILISKYYKQEVLACNIY